MLKRGLLLLLFFHTLTAFAQPSNHTYYVSPSGNNSDNGSREKPWATPGYASRQLQAGDSLIILNGKYLVSRFDDDIIIPPSGNADAWITIIGEKGKRPILAGKDNLYSAFILSGKNYLNIQNLEITSDNGAYFRDGIVSIGALSEHIILKDLFIHHIDQFGIDIGDVRHLQIIDCVVSYCGFGSIGGPTGVDGGWQHVLIDGCQLSYNGHYYQGGNGPGIYDRPDGFGIEPSSGPIEIQKTIVEHNQGDGLDSKAENTYIHNCIIANNSCDAIKLWGTGSKVENCLIYGRGDGNTTPTPWAAIVISTSRANATFEILNTTIDDSLGNGYFMYAQYDYPSIPIQITARNTIFCGRGSNTSIFLGQAINFTCEHNLFYVPQNSYVLSHGSSQFTKENLTALGVGNIYGDPRFKLTGFGSEGNYHLQANSPAIDAGNASVAPDYDLNSVRRAVTGVCEIGCYEYQASAPVNPPCLTVSVDALHFNLYSDRLSFLITNSGGDTLNWMARPDVNCHWISAISPENGRLAAGAKQQTEVAIDRTNLDPGWHHTKLYVQNDMAIDTIWIKVVASANLLEVQRFRQLEIDFSASQLYDNAYLDVNFSAEFIGPKSERYGIEGFWYEGNTWKCRMMPMSIGNWKFVTHSNDPNLDGKVGEFICMASAHPGILIVNAQYPYSFKLSDGGPFFWMGETAWCLMSDAVPFHDGTFQKYIDQRKRQKFNTIHFVLGTGGLPVGTQNPKNEGGSLWFSQEEQRINPDFFNWMDQRIAYLDSVQMAVGFFITWAQHFTTFSRVEFERLERYLIARYAAYPLLYWVLVGEFDEAGNLNDYRYHGSIIHSHDPYGHLISNHPGHSDPHNLGTSGMFANDSWFDFIMQQLPQYPGQVNETTLNSYVLADRVFNKPVVNIEFGYEEVTYQGRTFSADDVRKYAWSTVMAGGFPGYGHQKTIRAVDLEALDSQGALAMTYLYEFFDKLNWWQFQPENSRVDAGFCLAHDSKEYIIYLYQPGTVQVDLRDDVRAFRAEWFHPKNGTYQQQSHIVGGRIHSFTSPLTDDAVLHLSAIDDPVIAAGIDSILFLAKAGSELILERSVAISNSGSGVLNWTAREQSDKSWLNLVNAVGVTDDSLRVAVKVTGLTTGEYTTTVIVSDTAAVNDSVAILITVLINTPQPDAHITPISLDFGLLLTNLTFTIANFKPDDLSWAVVTAENPVWITSVYPESGSIAASQQQTITVQVTRTGLSDSEYQGIILLDVHGARDSVLIMMQVKTQHDYSVRINCGSNLPFTDTEGKAWQPDRAYVENNFGYIDGSVYQTSDPIASTLNDPLYQTERWGLTAYRFDVPAGSYHIVLHFAEIYCKRKNQRLMNVLIEGKQALRRLDLIKEAGHDVAVSFVFSQVNVTDGFLDIQFEPIKEQPKISAIEICLLSPKPILVLSPDSLDVGGSNPSAKFTITNIGGAVLNWDINFSPEINWIANIKPQEGKLHAGQTQSVTVFVNRQGLEPGDYAGKIQINSDGGEQDIFLRMHVDQEAPFSCRINCGSKVDYLDEQGFTWKADKRYVSKSFGYVKGQTYQTDRPIGGTDDDELYQSERWGMSAYRFTVPFKGVYTIELHFSEIYHAQPGQRIFNVCIEKKEVLHHLDIFDEVGKDYALIKTIAVKVDDGILDIEFSRVVESVKISAITVCFISETPSAGLADCVEGSIQQSAPIQLSLSPAYPNPFNMTTSFDLTLPHESIIQAEIYNLLGQQVTILKNEFITAQTIRLGWDGKNQFGQTVINGIYFLKVTFTTNISKRTTMVRRILLLK